MSLSPQPPTPKAAHRPVKHIPRDQTPAERFRRNAIKLMRQFVEMYPKEAVEIVKELIPNSTKQV